MFAVTLHTLALEGNETCCGTCLAKCNDATLTLSHAFPCLSRFPSPPRAYLIRTQALTVWNNCTGMLTEQLYGKHAAALYAQAADFNKTARFYYMKAQDAYYLANAQASYDDWRRARRQWDYFYRRK